jgi:hypothetical protein
MIPHAFFGRHVDTYAEGPPRQVPGFAGLHRMTTMLLAKRTRQAIAARLTILAPEEEEEMLREAGFSDVSLFYAGFSFKGWISYAA